MASHQCHLLLLSSLLLVLHVVGSLSDSGIKGPPHVSGPVATRQTFRLGDTIKLDCPIRGTPTPIVQWSKDGDSVTIGWERFKTTSHGLRIKEVILDDSGEYTCKGVNGFGSEQVTFEIVIVDPNAKATEPPSSSETIIGQEETETDVATWKKLLHSAGGGGSSGGSAPLLTETSHIPAGRLWQLPADSTLRLKCVAQGEPEPHLIWLKDGREIGDERRIGRWELQVARLNVDDSGTYSCKAVNPYGSINASFPIQVIDRSARKPEFVGLYPQNVTIMEGSTARLQCRVISDTPLFLQWLKRLDRVSPTYEQHRLGSGGSAPAGIVDHSRPDADGIIQVEGWRYRVLRSGHPAFQTDDGSYLDKWAFDDVSYSQSGQYICVASNSAGYTFREATVNVIPSSGRAFIEVPSSSGSGGVGGGSGGGLPTAALIALPVGAVAVLALVGWVIYYVKSERRMKARKEVGGPHQQLQRHHHRDIGSKDLSLTVPCLPRQEPPQPPHSESGMPMHHRLQPIHPIQQHQPATCMPYSTPFMGTLQLQQQQEILRMQHGVGMGGINGRQASVLRSCHSPAIGGTGTSSSGAGSSNHLYLNGGGGAAGNNWSNVYRPQPCGRSVDRNASYPYHHEASLLMAPPPPPSEGSEHAYASVHGVNYDEVRSTAANSITYPHRNNRFNTFGQRIEMV